MAFFLSWLAALSRTHGKRDARGISVPRLAGAAGRSTGTRWTPQAEGRPWCVSVALAPPAVAGAMAWAFSYPRREKVGHGDSRADGDRHRGEVGQPDFAAIAQAARLFAAAGPALLTVLIADHFAFTPKVRNCPV